MTSERKRLKSNGLNFVVTDYGKRGATPVVLLHGFPNSANVWEKQANFYDRHMHQRPTALAGAEKSIVSANLLVLHRTCCSMRLLTALPAGQCLGHSRFRVIAPDLRGAIGGESDAPQEVEAYNIPKVLVKDVAGKSSLSPPGCIKVPQL